LDLLFIFGDTDCIIATGRMCSSSGYYVGSVDACIYERTSTMLCHKTIRENDWM